MFRFASHRPRGIVAFSLAGLVMFCLHEARTGDAIAVAADAAEMAPLAAIDVLVRHKGLEFAPEPLCDEFAMTGALDRKDFTVVGVTVDRDDLAKVSPKYPNDYDASFVTVVDRRQQPNLVMTITSVILCRTSRHNIPGYAFSVYPDYPRGRIVAAAVGNKVGNAYRWSVVDMTTEMQGIFSTELQLWSSAAMRHFVEELRTKR
jgi:hypothetical protein